MLHPFHLLTPSIWPLASSLSLGNLALCAGSYFNGAQGGGIGVVLGLVAVGITAYLWWRDVSLEATLNGDHSFEVKRALSHAMSAFISTEILVFFSIFWAYFHSALAPAIELGISWPPIGITKLDATALPLFNTLLLLASGAAVTYGHHALVGGSRAGSLMGLGLTLTLAVWFTAIQGVEYVVSPFTFGDAVYGSAFYLATGTHGFHVVVGTLFLLVGIIRIANYSLTDSHHKGLENSILYWHFVDVVWLFLYGVVYWWGF